MKPQDQSAHFSGTANTDQTTNNNQTTEKPYLGSVSTGNTLIMLMQAARDNLTEHQLEHLADIDAVYRLETDNLAETAQTLGMFFTGADPLSVPDEKIIGAVFFGVAHQLDVLSGLMFVHSEASYLLDKIKTKKA